MEKKNRVIHRPLNFITTASPVVSVNIDRGPTIVGVLLRANHLPPPSSPTLRPHVSHFGGPYSLHLAHAVYVWRVHMKFCANVKRDGVL